MTKKIIITVLLSLGLAYGEEVKLPVSFAGAFKQTVTNEKKKNITYAGTIRFSDPANFKWVYNYPTRKDVCTDGEEILVVDHDLEQVSAYVIDKGLDLAAVPKNAKPHRKGVFVAKFQDTNYTIQIDTKGRLARIAYKDDLDNTVLIIFSDLLYSDKPIPSAKLKCNYPATYDQIRN